MSLLFSSFSLSFLLDLFGYFNDELKTGTADDCTSEGHHIFVDGVFERFVANLDPKERVQQTHRLSQVPYLCCGTLSFGAPQPFARELCAGSLA